MSSIFKGLDVHRIQNSNEKSLGSEAITDKGSVSPSVFEGLNVKNFSPNEPKSQQNPDSLGRFAARTAKSALSGLVGGTADSITSLYNIPAALTNAQKEYTKDIDPRVLAMASALGGGMEVPIPNQKDLPLIPSATEGIDRSIDKGTKGYTITPEDEKWFSEGVKFASSVAGGGGLGAIASKAGMKGLGKSLNTIGSTNPKTIAAAGASGAAIEKANESGISAPLSVATGIGTGLATQAALPLLNLKKSIPQGVTALTGFGKKNLNVPAVEAARDLNIELPGVAATNAILPAFANQALGKFPYFGNKLREKVSGASQQYQKAWNQMLDSVGSPRTPESLKKKDKTYRFVEKSIPKGASISPTPILDAISEVENIVKTFVHSEPTKKLSGIMGEFKKALIPESEKLPAGFEKFSPKVQEEVLKALGGEPSPIPVKELVRQKVELNKIMRDKNLFDRQDTDSLGFLDHIRNGLTKTLEQYGEVNPKFLKALKKADENFSKIAKRENLDDLLSGKIVDAKTGEVSYGSLLTIFKDRNKQKFLKNNLGEENYRKLQKFTKVAEAMESAKRNNPNPSGSATVGAVIGVITSLYYGNFGLPAAVIGGGAIATNLLTNNKFLNKATQFANRPTESLANQLSKIIKESTGVSVQTLLKETTSKEDSKNKEK